MRAPGFRRTQGQLSPAAACVAVTSVVALCLAAPARAAPAARRPHVVHPKLVKLVRAPYPDAARKAGRQGTVVMHVTVSEKGAVTEECLIEGREIVQDTFEIRRIQIGTIQPLGLVATARGVERLPPRRWKPARQARAHGL